VVFVLSCLLSYFLCGLAYVSDTLRMGVVDRPMWASKPNLGTLFLAGASWPAAEIANAYVGHRNQGFAAFLATLSATLRFCILALFAWLCIAAATYIFSNTVLQVICVVIFLAVGGRFVLPWVMLLLTPIFIIVGVALGTATPKTDRNDLKQIRWCRNCRYYRQSLNYEDVIDGMWRAERLPSLDELPCKISDASLAVWEEYFDMTMNNRAMFPKTCPLFEKK